MKRFVVALLLIAPLGAHAQDSQEKAREAFLNAKPVALTGTEKLCREQAVLIEQTYGMFRQGMSEEDAYSNQTNSSSSAKGKAWVKNMVHTIFSDSRSLVVNVSATAFYQEEQCNHDPEKYLN